MKKEVTVLLIDGTIIRTVGEVSVDPIENTLVISGDSGAYLSFYRPNLMYFAVSPLEEN
ncbi:hypothetical protein SEA_KRATARK_47 [Mycobacterium phage Kratark]|uniref:Uncharacterized protein n=1 Tax=Mycobacterium phage Arturo TaxID=2902839 RepID=K0G9W4_9CAUD|nr:hypothetical protein FGG45_gp47 [Mycobacterium phage Arturo]AFU20499.1 hypothetical protein ARTURO_46 [Mycobacterium phage Arturo]APM00081.1 hypothetical protein SEA_KRATARK_47 [Mycobacterium phage Kratark]QBP29247.1 hypothetical protein SEA_PHIGHTER1804_47 [Mycobacterium phage Phighter1804]QBP29336.1 hypothetical protein SEA_DIRTYDUNNING_46 [Mycobacterium phage DirtyDunning]